MVRNPNPARITDASWWFMEQLLALQPGTENGGIYADKCGYHNTRAANQPPRCLTSDGRSNYSIRDAEDRGGPSDKAAAYDWTFRDAQAGNYATISKYCKRLLASGQDPNDPRANGWREWLGQLDSDRVAEGWDFRYRKPRTPDDSHLWHIHLSEDRDKVTSYDNKKALLSVLEGETVAQWLGSNAHAMFLIQIQGNPALWVSNGLERRWIRNWEKGAVPLIEMMKRNGLQPIRDPLLLQVAQGSLLHT